MRQQSILLRAVNPKRNMNRFYHIQVGEDLFESPYIMTTYGRSGTSGRSKSYAFHTWSELDKHLRKTLRKRLNAKKRIGCNYQIQNHHLDTF